MWILIQTEVCAASFLLWIFPHLSLTARNSKQEKQRVVDKKSTSVQEEHLENYR